MAIIEAPILKNLLEAEMLDADGNESILTGPLSFSPLLIPQYIYLIGDFLYYRDDPEYRRVQVNDTGALNAFVRIKTPDDILRFAQRYGPLGLCKHGLPPMHRGSWYQDKYENGELVEVTYIGEWNPTGGAGERGWCPPCSPEPVEKWLEYSELALSYLNIAALLKTEKERTIRGIRQLFLKDGINEWLGDAGVRLKLDWDRQEPILTLSGGGLFGALGVQLITAVTSYTTFVCSGCGRLYLRQVRKPKPGQRNFCPDCKLKVASKLRQRDLQKRRKGVNHNDSQE